MLLRDARTAESGLMDLLSWEMLVGDGLLRNVDGALAATLEYRGPDLASATAPELDALSRDLAAVLDLLGDGWMVHAEALRLPAPPYPATASFPDPATRAIDEAREAAYGSRRARYHSRYYLTLTHRRPRAMRRNLLLMRAPDEAEVRDDEDGHAEEFEETVADVARQFATHLWVRRLRSADLVRYLHATLTGRDQAVQVPSYAFSLESLFAAGELHGGTELRLSDQHIVPVSLLSYPDGTTPAALAFLDQLALPYRAVFRLLCLERYTAKAAIRSVRSKWSTAAVSLKHFAAFALGGSDAKPKFADRHPSRMAEDADEAIAELDRDETSAGHLTSTIVTFDSDRRRAVRQAQEIVKQLRNAGFVAMVETFNAVESYLGSLPAHGYYNCRRPIVSNRAFVDLAPTTAVWSGHLDNPHPALTGPCVVAATEGSTPFWWSLASGDVQHTLVAGPIGAGKSTLINLLIAQYLRYPDAQVFSMDKGWSQYVLCRAAGGCHYAPSASRRDGDRFAPLAHVDDAGERAAAADWIEDLLQLQGIDVGPPERAAIHRALELLAASSHRTLTAFAAKVQDTRLRAALSPYTGDGTLAHLFGAERSPLRDGHLHVVEMEALLDLRKKALAPAMTHLFREIERRLDGRPTLLVVEEAPNYLADSLFTRRMRQWLLELRKRNAGVVFVTQILGSFLDSDLRDAILENCPTRVFLPNPAARDPHAAESYRAFGLNDRQIALIAAATARRDYYLDTPEGSRMIQLGLTDLELALLGRSGPRVRDEVDRAIAEHGDGWIERVTGSPTSA
jgi:type IV secretion system protein TrbE